MAQPRDENGCLIPKDGTLSLKIYRLMRQGVRQRDIMQTLDISRNRSRCLMYRMRHPDRHPQRAPAESPYVRKLIAVLGISVTEARTAEARLDTNDRSFCGTLASIP